MSSASPDGFYVPLSPPQGMQMPARPRKPKPVPARPRKPKPVPSLAPPSNSVENLPRDSQLQGGRSAKAAASSTSSAGDSTPRRGRKAVRKGGESMGSNRAQADLTFDKPLSSVAEERGSVWDNITNDFEASTFDPSPPGPWPPNSSSIYSTELLNSDVTTRQPQATTNTTRASPPSATVQTNKRPLPSDDATDASTPYKRLAFSSTDLDTRNQIRDLNLRLQVNSLETQRLRDELYDSYQLHKAAENQHIALTTQVAALSNALEDANTAAAKQRDKDLEREVLEGMFRCAGHRMLNNAYNLMRSAEGVKLHPLTRHAALEHAATYAYMICNVGIDLEELRGFDWNAVWAHYGGPDAGSMGYAKIRDVVERWEIAEGGAVADGVSDAGDENE